MENETLEEIFKFYFVRMNKVPHNWKMKNLTFYT